MGSLNPAAAAAAASSIGDWRHQFNQEARKVFVSMMLQTLRRHLPVEEARRRNIATQIERQSYFASKNQSDYFKNIAAVMLHVESPYRNHHHPAPSLPQQGNNPAHSSASTLISQQQTELPDSSTLVQASSLSIDGQSSTGESQTSALHHTSGRSTIGRMQPMVIQSAIQSGIQHNPLDTVLQPMNQQQQHPEPSTNQQFFVQQTERTQQANTPLQQLVTGELSNLHPSQPNNLLNQHQSQGFMLPQPQQLDYAALYNEDSLWDNSQSSLGNFDVSENENDALYMQEISERLNPCSQPSIVPGIQDDIATMNEVEDQEILEREKNFDKWADIQRPSASDTQMKNIGDEDGCLDSTGLTVKEDSNCFFKTDMPTNLKKRKYAHLPCSSG